MGRTGKIIVEVNLGMYKTVLRIVRALERNDDGGFWYYANPVGDENTLIYYFITRFGVIKAYPTFNPNRTLIKFVGDVERFKKVVYKSLAKYRVATIE